MLNLSRGGGPGVSRIPAPAHFTNTNSTRSTCSLTLGVVTAARLAATWLTLFVATWAKQRTKLTSTSIDTKLRAMAEDRAATRGLLSARRSAAGAAAPRAALPRATENDRRAHLRCHAAQGEPRRVHGRLPALRIQPVPSRCAVGPEFSRAGSAEHRSH